jgi:ABC-2 type transport system ATP-binding protein
MAAVIQTQGLTKSYGKHRGIIDINLTVNEGEIYGFIGPNGAGKSTMIKTLLNFLFPNSGSASILGLDCVADSRRIKAQTAYVPSDINYYEELTVGDLLSYSDSFYPAADSDYTQELIQRFELDTKKKIGQLSMGNKKKAALVAALSCRPKLMILDEPTNGLDPLMRQKLFDALHEQREAGCTIFLSSHNLDEVQTLCSRVAIIREGRIVDIKELGVLSAEKAKKVTVIGEALPDSFDSDAVKIVSKTKDRLVFTYHSTDMGALLQLLGSMKAEDFLVEDIKLSDIFLSYYK